MKKLGQVLMALFVFAVILSIPAGLILWIWYPWGIKVTLAATSMIGVVWMTAHIFDRLSPGK